MGNDRNYKKEPRRNARDRKKYVTKINNAFDELISRLDTVKERLSDLEDMTFQSRNFQNGKAEK